MELEVVPGKTADRLFEIAPARSAIPYTGSHSNLKQAQRERFTSVSIKCPNDQPYTCHGFEVQTNMSTVHRNPNKKLVVKPNPSIDDITAVEKQVVRSKQRASLTRKR